MLCGCPCCTSAFAIFCVRVSLERERRSKNMSRRALSRCEIPGDKIEGKEELKGMERK